VVRKLFEIAADVRSHQWITDSLELKRGTRNRCPSRDRHAADFRSLIGAATFLNVKWIVPFRNYAQKLGKVGCPERKMPQPPKLKRKSQSVLPVGMFKAVGICRLYALSRNAKPSVRP
jgi:hypothetical protein